MTADGSDRSFGAPRFDVVLRGYDRRQVDEHLSRLQRLMGRMRNDLDTARGWPGAPSAGGRPRPTPRPRPDGSPPTGANDVVGSFTDRMQAILQSAEEEAAEVRNRTRAEEDAARRTLADLVRRRDAVLAELTRVRGQLESLLSGPTARIALPTQESGPDQREPGAGQPLPGTPELFEPASEGEPVAAAGAPAAPGSAAGSTVGRAVTATAAFPAPGGASTDVFTESPHEPDASAADRAAPLDPAEQTMLMEPLTDEPESEAAPGESTQAVAPPVRGPAAAEQDAGPDDPASAAGPVEAPTQVARSG